METKGLNSNQLKLLAVITMTIDHIGAYIFPGILWMRIAGRLAFPIFAFMVGQGAKHTRSLKRYWLTMAVSALICQGVSTVFRGDLYQCILVTFTLSLGVIFLIKNAEERKTTAAWFGAVCGFGCVLLICKGLPYLLPGFDVDYGLLGVLAPVAVYLAQDRHHGIFALGICLMGIAGETYWIQWLSLAAIPLLLLYNGQRGKGNMKWFFYIYYPAHLVVIYLAEMLINR